MGNSYFQGYEKYYEVQNGTGLFLNETKGGTTFKIRMRVIIRAGVWNKEDFWKFEP